MNLSSAQLKPWEHCPECGALLVAVSGGAICPHCGFDCDYPEERLVISLPDLAGRRGEGIRFHLMDDRAPQAA